MYENVIAVSFNQFHSIQQTGTDEITWRHQTIYRHQTIHWHAVPQSVNVHQRHISHDGTSLHHRQSRTAPREGSNSEEQRRERGIISNRRSFLSRCCPAHHLNICFFRSRVPSKISCYSSLFSTSWYAPSPRRKRILNMWPMSETTIWVHWLSQSKCRLPSPSFGTPVGRVHAQRATDNLSLFCPSDRCSVMSTTTIRLPSMPISKRSAKSYGKITYSSTRIMAVFSKKTIVVKVAVLTANVFSVCQR